LSASKPFKPEFQPKTSFPVAVPNAETDAAAVTPQKHGPTSKEQALSQDGFTTRKAGAPHTSPPHATIMLMEH
jgi:hypothetical protein